MKQPLTGDSPGFKALRAAFCVAMLTGLFAIVPCAVAETLPVSSTRDSGEGTLRAAIHAANRAPGSTIEIRLGDRSEIVVHSALPALTARGTRLDGGGTTLRQARGCRRAGGQKGCDGIVVEAREAVVAKLRIVGFTFDGVAVRGTNTRDVRIERIEAIDNLDDGVGVSAGAGPVVVDHCLLMGNGFRTKGKGLLVFDSAVATLRDSMVIGNRDGVTVSRGASALLERVLVAGNYDKGVGVSAARVRVNDSQILANGVSTEGSESPNADGVRVGLDGEAVLRHCRVAGSGDGGVVVLDTSRAELERCIVEANRGEAISVAPDASLRER